MDRIGALLLGSARLVTLVGAGGIGKTSLAEEAVRRLHRARRTKHGDAHEALQLGRAALTYQLSRGHQWGTTWAVHVRMWTLARLITDHIAAGNARRSTVVEQASEIAYLAAGLETHRGRLGLLIDNMGPFADETLTAEHIAREVLDQQTYNDAEKR